MRRLAFAALALALPVAALVACSSSDGGGGSATSTPDAATVTDASGTPDSATADAAPEAAVDAGPTFKTCTDAELAAATLATNGADISFFNAGVDGGAYAYDNNCVRIPQGKDVGWYGDFTMHPLANDGEPGTPIPNVSTGNDSGRITFPTKGKFSFHCSFHSSTMYGTVQVE